MLPSQPSSASFDTECRHETIESGTCVECGLSMSCTGSHLGYEQDYSLSHQRSAGVSSLGFEKDLAAIRDLSEEIKAWVIRKTVSAPKGIHRMGCREQILFAYVYLGHLTLGYTVEPEKIAESLQMKPCNIAPAIKLASGISSIPLPQSVGDTVTAPMVIISPVTYLKSTLQLIDKTQYLQQITDITNKALDADELLYEERPRSMAIGFIKYYLDINKIDVPKYHTFFNVTPSSVKTSVKKITESVAANPVS